MVRRKNKNELARECLPESTVGSVGPNLEIPTENQTEKDDPRKTCSSGRIDLYMPIRWKQMFRFAIFLSAQEPMCCPSYSRRAPVQFVGTSALPSMDLHGIGARAPRSNGGKGGKENRSANPQRTIAAEAETAVRRRMREEETMEQEANRQEHEEEETENIRRWWLGGRRNIRIRRQLRPEFQ